ncbi:MAG: hypothetical protein ACHQ2F_01090 [Desulfobaccales bacterium]
MVKKLFILMSPASQEIFGACYDQETAEKEAPKHGPGVQILACELGEDGKWQIQGSPRQVERTQILAEERTRVLAILKAQGIGGLVYRAAAEGMSPEQFRSRMNGLSDHELWGPGFRPIKLFNLAAQGWSDPAIRADFGTLERFQIYKKYKDLGCVRTIG